MHSHQPYEKSRLSKPVLQDIVALFLVVLCVLIVINMESFSEPSEVIEVIRNLSMTSRPQVVSFQEMMKLMQQCELLDKLKMENIHNLPTNTLSKGIAANPISLLSGILPG